MACLDPATIEAVTHGAVAIILAIAAVVAVWGMTR